MKPFCPEMTISGVRFRKIPDFRYYWVSEFGDVISTFTGKPTRISVTIDKDGYRRVCLCNKGIGKNAQIHRLVLRCFVGECPKGKETRHLNNDPSDNRLTNLSWGTKIENGQDRVAHGKSGRGVMNCNAKLDDDKVRAIRASDGITTLAEEAEKYGVHFSLIGHVRNQKIWRHVNG